MIPGRIKREILSVKMPHLKFVPVVLALQILLLPAIILIITALFFWLTLPITAYHFPLSLVVTLVASFLVVKKNKNFKESKGTEFIDHDGKMFLKATVLFIILILVSFFISAAVYDFSWDGQVYHQPGVILLAKSWNPFYQHFLGAYDYSSWKTAGERAPLIDHFSKASWITAASLYAFTGSLEAGKMFHFLFLAAVFLVAFHFLSFLKSPLRTGPMNPGKSRFIIAALVALNPVCLYQLFSFYNDGLLASLLTILIVSAFQYLIFGDRKTMVLMAVTLPTLINIKFTGLVYAGIITALIWIAVLIYKRSTQVRFILYMGAAFVTAVVFIGYQPYITNILHKGNPFYPAIGIGKDKNIFSKNIESGQAPQAFIKKDRFRKLAYSLFSRSSNNMNLMPVLKIPFSIDRSEIFAFHGADTRYGGFGPLFGSVLLLVAAGALVLLLFKSKRIILTYTLIAAAVILLSTLINPEAWWARLSPQLWLLPIIFIAASYYLGKNKFIQYLRGFFIFLLLFNCFIILYTYTGHQLKINRLFKGQMHWMAKISQKMNICWEVYPHNSYLSTQYRLRRFKVPHKMEKTLKTKRTRPIIGARGARFYIDDRVHQILKLQRSRKKRKQIYSAPGKKTSLFFLTDSKTKTTSDHAYLLREK